MPIVKELTMLMDDRPGTLGKVCSALAHRNINILAFHCFPVGGKSVTRFVIDDSSAAKSVLDAEGLVCAETEVVQVKLPHRPGELARIASRLGDARININYAYCGFEPTTNAPLVFIGVSDASHAAPVLEQLAAAAAKP